MKLTENIARLRANNIVVLIYLIFITNAIVAPILFGYNQIEVESSIFIKVIKYLPILVYILINYDANFYKDLLSLATDKLFFLLSITYIASSIWSPAKSSTAANATQFVIFIWFCNVIFSQKRVEIFKVLLMYLTLVIVFSWILFIFFPSQGKMDGFHNGLARGVFMHKNVLGSILVLLFPVLLISSTFRVKQFILIVACTSLIFFTGSTTSIITLVIMLLFIPFIKKFKGTSLAVIITSIVCLTALASYRYSDIIFNIFGKSEDLTGRVILWNGLVDAINQRPYLGWGYFGFWESKAKETYLGDMEWITGKAHNAFIDILLSGGYVLLSIVLIILTIILKNILYTRDKNIRNYGLLTFLAVIILSLTEINLFVHNNIYLFIVCFLPKLVQHFYNQPEFSTIGAPSIKRSYFSLMNLTQ